MKQHVIINNDKYEYTAIKMEEEEEIYFFNINLTGFSDTSKFMIFSSAVCVVFIVYGYLQVMI